MLPLSPTNAACRLHHAGFVVAHIEDALPGFAQSIHAPWMSEIFHDPIQRVNVAFLGQAPDALPQVELIEPAGANSPVSKFLNTGGGLHHLCYQVSELDAEIKQQKKLGATLVRRPQAAVAFGGRRIAWVYTPQKLLIEFLEEDLFTGQHSGVSDGL